VSRRETFDQLRADRRQSEIFLQEHIQRLELREDERRRKRSSSEDSSHGGRRRRHDHDGGGRRNQLPQRQPPPIKIPMFKGENDPNLYIEWEQKVDQIFNIHLLLTMTTTLGLGKEKKERMRNLLPKTTHLGPIRLEPPMKVQTLPKVQELVP